MAGDSVFTQVPADLAPVLEELKQREPIFHTAAFGQTRAELGRAMVSDYWEVGASGRRYSRDFILRTLEEAPPEDAVEAGWTCSDFGIRALGAEVFLLTYTLRQWERVTRRTTIWQRTSDGWRILFHQGTIAAHVEDDVNPPAEEMPHPPAEWTRARVRPAHARVRAWS
ncbi:MAG TPA: DUF4440 domain-containing protein [Acidobacteriaceae bacterium]|nr:DUF4440 domain-containing protein [Acidobacteriaceae bacterium]